MHQCQQNRDHGAIKLKPKNGRVEVEQEAEEVVICEGVVKEVSQFTTSAVCLQLMASCGVNKGKAWCTSPEVGEVRA